MQPTDEGANRAVTAIAVREEVVPPPAPAYAHLM